MTHVMLDIETLGTTPGSIILSVGAAAFDPRGEGCGPEFYRNIDPKEMKCLGFTSNPSTVKWWKDQGEKAQESLTVNRVSPLNALIDLTSWFKQVKGKQLWCQGANFDAPLLEPMFQFFGMTTPWKFYNVRDTRTVYEICNFNPYSIKREGTYHNALDDSKHQIICVQKAMKALS